MTIQPIRVTRNGAAVVLAILSGFAMVTAPVAAIVGIWQGDLRWLATAGAVLILAVVLYFLATQLFDNEPDAEVITP